MGRGIPSRRRAGGARDRPGMKAHLWGYNGQSPGPTIEVVKAIACASTSPTACRAHHHPLARPALPNGMTALAVDPPQISRARRCLRVRRASPGTFMYHPHADEMTQMAMGMMGFG